MSTVDTLVIQEEFFTFLFREQEGYVCIATSAPDRDKTDFRQTFFEWPKQKADLAAYIEKMMYKRNVWFCVNLLDIPERKKDFCLPTNLLWADLDNVNPESIDPRPSCLIKSSTDRYQAIWRLDRILPPDVAEAYSRRLAYQIGADRSGWDLTQLLRVPLSYNYKYGDNPEVQIVWADAGTMTADVVDRIPDVVVGESEPEDIPDPTKLPSLDQILYKKLYEIEKTPGFKELMEETPPQEADWSKLLWRLINMCFEIGLDREEVFVVAMSAGCNKYARDNRPLSFLWREVLKAESVQKRITILSNVGFLKPLVMPELISPGEARNIDENFISQYKVWALNATDAAEEYHELSAFMLLSAVLSTGLKLTAKFGEIVPNLWGLVLGESTLTRKTTAMRMAIEIITKIDPEMILATDGSAEGMISALANRPRRTSIFYKDEVSGFFDSINRKDYLAGMPETMTQLYDVPPIMNRVLRRETITITYPYFIFFGGGIRDKVYQLLNEEYITSGFIPRFLVVSAETDLERIRPTGPPTEDNTDAQNRIVTKIADLYEIYNREAEFKLGGTTSKAPIRFDAKLTDEAWGRYGVMEQKLIREGNDSPLSLLALPTFTRLGFSILKMAVLLGAARREPDSANRVEVDVQDVVQAASYVQRWGRHTVDLIQATGKGTDERMLDRIYRLIQDNPGISKSSVMQRFHLMSRIANELLTTLVDRGMIEAKKEGRGVKYRPTHYGKAVS